MADSKLFRSEDLTECGICLMTIEEPKALPCLHSYCLKCLSKWAEGEADTIRCPICSQDFPIPPEGIKGFITNFVINTLKDRREMVEQLQAKDAKAPCSCCGATDNKAEAYCTDCGGFICEECGGTHRRVLVFLDHKTVSYADLQTGKVDIKSIVKQQCCKEHKGQVLQFFCKTCGVLICHACTVVDHPTSTHSLVNLKHATKEQRSEVKQLMEDCTRLQDVVNDSLKSVEEVQEHLEKNIEKAMVDMEQAADKAVAEIQQRKTEIQSELTEAAAVNKKQIEAQRESLQMLQTCLQTALLMATEVTQTGSDHDLALVFSSLKENLSQLRNTTLGTVDRNLGELDFVPDQTALPLASLGSLSIGKVATSTVVEDNAAANISMNPKHDEAKEGRRGSVGTWKLVTEFTGGGKHRLDKACHTTLTPRGELIVADFGNYGDGKVLVFDQSGNFNYSINTKQGLDYRQESKPWNVVVSPERRIFITHCVPYVNVYDKDATYIHQFFTKPTRNVPFDARNAKLRGLAMDKRGTCLLVGEANQKYISKHRLDGTHIKSIRVSIVPGYIAVTSTGKIVVSSGGEYSLMVQILDPKGTILHTVDPPSAQTLWTPYGLYCSANDDLYIANSVPAYATGGIYRYTASGEYVGCLTNEIYDPPGVLLTDNDNKLIVSDLKSVKIFTRQ